MAIWLPRCPQCGGSLILAPANQFTKHIVEKTEVYCQQCQWQGGLAANIKQIYASST
jgi:uncharacterized protein with PIN domain